MSKLSDISNIKSILSRHGFTFSKSLGQNFLVNPSVCPKMAQACAYSGDFGIIEIGPGIGVLTYELASRYKKVVAIELDERLIPVLHETLSDFDNVKIVNNDVMKIDINNLIKTEFNGMDAAVCANLPYYITSPVIMKLLEDRLPVKSITVMVQKEAAQRICAEPGTRDAGAVSIAVRYYAEPEMLFKVSSGSFMPAPKVDSAVIRLNVREKPSVCVKNEKRFFEVVKASFAQRRKTILNSLSSGMGIDKPAIAKILKELNIPENSRAEQLTMEQFAMISDNV